MLQSIPVVDETNNYRLWEHIQKITWFQILRNKIFPPFIDTSHQPLQANKQRFNLKVATQASENSELCLTMFWKITVSRTGLISQ